MKRVIDMHENKFAKQGKLRATQADLELLADNLAGMFGPDCEVLLHDLTGSHESTVVKIANGHVTGRKLGDPPTNIFYEQVMAGGGANPPPYVTRLEDGRIIKSSTTFLRDHRGKITGAVCVNYDATALVRAFEQVRDFLGAAVHPEEGGGGEVYARSLNEVFEHFLAQAEKTAGKPGREMNKAEKLHALAYLRDRGVLQFAKANVRLCEFFEISKFTLYNYLEIVRNRSEGASEPE